MGLEGDDIRVGDLVVSPRTRRLVAAGREIPVTSRELEVVAALALHPDWVCSAEQLCSDAPDTYSSPGAVNVHVSHLRRKLAESGFPDAIATVRGAGYTMRRAGCGGSSTCDLPQFVDRSSELEALAVALREARAGHAGFVLVTGEAGIGKTTLVERSLADASGDPPILARAVCDADGSPQYWVWRQLVLEMPAGAPRAAGRETVLRLIGGSGSEYTPPSLSLADRAVAHDAMLSFIASVCGGPTPVVLFVDDVHWTHPSSIKLLGYVIKRMEGLHLLVIATCREEDLNTNPQVAAFVADACGSSTTTHLRLRGFGPECVATIVQQALGERARSAAGRIYTLTDGNPLFVRELVQALAESGDAAVTAGVLARLPATIGALVRARTAGLPERTKHALTVAAAIGVEFDADVVDRACGLDGGVASALEPALASLFVSEAGAPGRYRFRHPLFRQALYESLSAPEREAVHAAVYEAVRLSARSQPRRLFELAHHASLAGIAFSRTAVGYLAAVERESYRRYAFEEAARYCERALEILDTAFVRPEAASRVRSALLERLGAARAAEGDTRAALASYAAALEERRTGDLAVRARLHTRVAAAELDVGEWDECLSALDLADACLEAIDTRADTWWTSWIHARLQRAEYEFLAGEDVITALSPSLAEAVTAHGTPVQRVMFLEKRAAALWKRSHFAPTDACVQAARDAAGAVASREMEYARARALELLGGVLAWHRDLEESEEVLDRALNLMRRCQDPIGETNVLFYRAVAARFANDVALTDARAHELLEHARSVSSPEFSGAAKGCLAWVALRRDEPDVADKIARDGMRDLTTAYAFPYAWTAAWPLAVCALAAGRLDEAASCANAVLDECRERLPEAISRPLRDGLSLYAAGDPTAALALFSKAAEQSALLGYA